MNLSFFVPGIPATQGSKRAFAHRTTGKIIVKEDCKKTKDWRGDVKRFALEAFQGQPTADAVTLAIVFYLPRPKGHLGAKGLRPSAPPYHTTKPDCTKMLRAVEDALKGLIWKDDSQVIEQQIRKHYTQGQPGAQVTIHTIEA